MTEKEKHPQEPTPTGDRSDRAAGDELSEDQLGAVAGGTTTMEPLPDPTPSVSVRGTTATTKLKTTVNGTAEIDGVATTFASESFGVETPPNV